MPRSSVKVRVLSLLETEVIFSFTRFTSRKDCQGQYFLQASLLDQRRSKVPGFSYDTALKQAPMGHWHKEEHIFTNIPPGIRFVELRDGGHDCKNWAGFYGAKMVGAFVGVMPNCKF